MTKRNVVSFPGGRLPAMPGNLIDVLPADLARRVRDVQGYRQGSDGESGLVIEGAEPAFHPEAPRWLAALQPMFRPPDVEGIVDWLGELVEVALQNGPATAEEVWSRARVLQRHCGDLPAGVWNDKTLTLLVRACRDNFWPSPGKVYHVLEPEKRQIELVRRGLEKITAARKQPAKAPVDDRRTPEALAYVRAQVEGFKADMAAKRMATSHSLPGLMKIVVSRARQDDS